jgi:hypothetical protein
MERTLLIAASLLAVPFYALLIYLTRGSIEPRPPGSDTWNIQYLAHFAIAGVGMLIGYCYRATLGKKWLVAIWAWNGLLAGLALYAVFTLWGEKY